MANDLTKILKGAKDAVVAVENSSTGLAKSDAVNQFPFFSVGLVEDDSIKFSGKKVVIPEAGGGEIQSFELEAKISSLETESDEFVNAIEPIAKVADNCSLYLFGGDQSHKIKNLGVTVEKNVNFGTKDKSQSNFVLRGSKNDLSELELGKTATYYSSDRAYRYNQMIKKIRRENLVFEAVPYLGYFSDDFYLYDASKNRKVGTLYGGPTWGTAPDGVNSILTFDGVNDYADFGNILNDDGVSDLLIEFWAYGGDLNMFGKRSGWMSGVGWDVLMASPGQRFYLSDGVNSVVCSWDVVATSGWNHYAIAVDRNGYARAYRNSVQYGGNQDVSSVVGSCENSNSFTIGKIDIYGVFPLGALRVYNFGAGGLPSNIATIISNHYNAEKSIFGL